MSMIVILAPLIASAWPSLASAILGSVSVMGYSVIDPKTLKRTDNKAMTCKEIDVKNSNVISEFIKDKQTITVKKNNILVSFQKGADNRCKITVMGEGKTDAELETIGQEMAKVITQKYVYNKIMSELQQREFSIVEEKVEEDNTIRINARRYVS